MKINKTIRQFFTLNYKIKIFSLLCSLFLWFYVTLGNQFEDIVQVPVETINEPVDKVLVKPLPKSISVKCRGLGGVLLQNRLKSLLSIPIDLSQYPKDTEIVPSLDMITKDRIEKDLIPVRIEQPKPIFIAYDLFASKKVPIVSRLEFKPKQGYMQVGDVILSPDSLIIEGAAKEVDPIDAIYTESKVLQVFRSIEGEVELVDTTSSHVKVSAAKVHFKADIQGIGDRMYTDIPVEVINAPSDMTVSAVPSMVSIRLQGGVEMLKELTKEDIQVTIDYRSRFRYGRRIPAMIHVPPNITFTDVKPKDFELLVER